MSLNNQKPATPELSLEAKATLASIESLESQGANFWHITPEVGQFLMNTIIENNCQSVLEIGTSSGYSGIHIATALKSTGGHLYTIESHSGRYSLAQKNFQSAHLSQFITQIKGHAPQVLIPDDQKPKSLYRKSGILHPQNRYSPIFKDLKFDLIFIDATKKETLSFFNAIQPYLNSPHIIITDNVLSHKAEIQPFQDHITTNTRYQTELLNLGTGLLVSKSN